MARKGDIDSKPVSARVPMEVFIRLQTIAYHRKKTMSAFLCEVLSDENFGQGGQTKIEYRDRIVPKIEYRDRIVEKKVPVEYHHDKIIDNPKLIKENELLKKEIEVLNDKLKSLINKKLRDNEPPHISYSRFLIENGTADERDIQLIKEYDERLKKLHK